MNSNRSYGSTQSQTSYSLLVRAQNRDAVAWQRIVDCYGPIIYRWLRVAGLESEFLPDVAQEVFLAAYRRFDRVDFDHQFGSFRGWLRLIAKRKFLDHMRRRSRQDQHQEKPASDVIDQVRFPQDTEESVLGETQLLYRQVETFIRQEFSPAHCEAFFAISLDDQSPADVAQRLGMTRNSVYLACSRIRRRVRKEFAELFPDTSL